MAKKLVFITSNDIPFKEDMMEYKFVPGMAASQRKKNVITLHDAIKYCYPNKKVLEISTKSDNPLGVALSAFNLQLDGHYIEQIFQSSKVFEGGIQYPELINEHPKNCKKFIKSLTDHKLESFKYKGVTFPLEPKTLFYDYIYLHALAQNKELSDQLKDYDIFTDIEFNFEKSINCQARTCAIYSYLLRTNQVDEVLNDIEKLKALYSKAKKHHSYYL